MEDERFRCGLRKSCIGAVVWAILINCDDDEDGWRGFSPNDIGEYLESVMDIRLVGMEVAGVNFSEDGEELILKPLNNGLGEFRCFVSWTRSDWSIFEDYATAIDVYEEIINSYFPHWT